MFVLSSALFFAACSPEPTGTEQVDLLNATISSQPQENGKTPLDVPTLTCGASSETSMELIITAGATGASGGFDIQWQLASSTTDQVVWYDESCEFGFPSNNNNAYDLDPGASYSLYLETLVSEVTGCTPVVTCGQVYAFRVRAKNEGGKDGLGKSPWSETFYCTPCEAECEGTYMWGNTPLNQIDTEANWGWAHEFDATQDGSSQIFDLYNGAAQNDLDKGKDLGDMTVSVFEGVVSLDYAQNIEITHLYISDEKPTEGAPGQFGKTGNLGDANQDGKFWIIVKADVCL